MSDAQSDVYMQVAESNTSPANPGDEGTVKTEAVSSLASGPRFVAWLAAARIRWVQTDTMKQPHPALSQFSRLEVFSLPNAVLDLMEMTLEPEFLRAVKAWARANPQHLTSNDPYLIAERWGILSAAFCMICEAENDQENEANRRRGVDVLIQIAMDWHTKRAASFLVEQQIHVYQPPESASLIRKAGEYAIADTVVVVKTDQNINELLKQAVARFTGPGAIVLPELHWQRQLPLQITLIVFACEYKRRASEANSNQVLFDLATAQHQRRALGLPKRHLIGASYSAGVFRIITMWWEPVNGDDQLFAHLHPRKFQLTNPMDFMNVYTFLCNLGDEVKIFGGDLGQDVQRILQALTDHRWRTPPPPKEPSGGQRKGGKASEAKNRGGAPQGGGGIKRQMEEASSDVEDYVEDSTSSKSSIGSLTAEHIALIPQDPVPLPQKVGEWVHNIADGSGNKMIRARRALRRCLSDSALSDSSVVIIP